MLEAYFQGIMLTSLLGTALAIALLVLKPLTQKFFSESWHYYIWLVVLLTMLFPIRIEFPELPHNPAISHASAQFAATMENALESVGLKESAADKVMYDEEGHRLYSRHLLERRIQEIAIERKMDSIAFGWFGVALSLFLYKIVSYHYYVRKLQRISCKVECPEIAEYTNRKIQVRMVQESAGQKRRVKIGNSPLLMGVIHPILLLPDKEMTREQLHNVLAHEMTHLRRNDVLYKWFVVLVKCIHWFNPFVHMVGEQINQACEISCDLSVTEFMTREQKMSYVDTILALFAEQRNRDYALTMGMTGSKELLKKRFLRMRNRIDINEKMRKVSRMIAAVMLVSVMLMSGGIAARVFPDLSDQNLAPVLSVCKICGQEVLFNYREPVIKKEQEILYPYLNYLFYCEHCNYNWSEEQKVTSDYVINVKTNRSEKVEDLMTNARLEEVSDELWAQIFK